MNYTEFQFEIQKNIKEIVGDGYNVYVEKVMKNNDMELVAIMIRENDETGAVPTIYLEDFYEMYCDGVSIADIVNSILAIHQKFSRQVKITFDEFMDYNKVKDKIMFKLVNYERNQIGLKTIPHKRYLDLAIVFYLLLEDGVQRMASTIHDTHLELWNVDVDELFEVAYVNTISKLPVDIKNIRDVIMDLYKEKNRLSGLEDDEDDTLDGMEEYTYPMYVISNKVRTLGASSILFDNVLKYMYDKFEGEYYILPSSIHEVIVVPKTNMTVSEMKNMVMEINENEVDYLEILSDNVYCYNGEKLQLA